MSKSRFFTPKGLDDSGVPPSFSGKADIYFKVAQELRERCKIDKADMPGHYYVFPSVIMYVSAFEAFLSEYLALILIYNEEDNEAVEKIVKVKNEQKVEERLKGILRFFDNGKVTIDYNDDWHQNFIALKELRNSAAHYNPEFISHIFWPKRLENALKRSKIGIINSDWASNFSKPAVSDWAYETIKILVYKFSEITGWINPFEMNNPFGWEFNKKS